MRRFALTICCVPALLVALASGLAPVAAQEGGVSGQEIPGAAPGPEGGPPPKMVIATQALDVGTVIQGEDAVGTFVIRNEGEGELRILKAKPG